MTQVKIIALVLSLALLSPPWIKAEQPPVEASISLNFQNTDIDFVLKFLSDVTGTLFIKSDAVRGFVTLIAPGKVSADEALRVFQTVLDMKGFTMVRGPGSMVRVLTQAEAAQTELEVEYGNKQADASLQDRMMTQVIPLRFVSATELKNQLSSMVSKGGSLISDERMNALVVTDMTPNIRRLLKMVECLDVRTPQVLIEALIMEVSLTTETKLGIEWGYNSSFHGDGYRYEQTVGQKFDVASLISQGLKYSVLRTDGDMSALLQALATDSNVNILSTPHIMTLNNQPATIRVGEEVPILTQTRNIQGGETIRSFDYKSVAVELEVTPRINDDREVFLKVHPLIKKIVGFNAELNAPILATREAQTSVLIQDGQTIVIGGLMKDDKAHRASKLPILGDIPLLGMLFRSRNDTKEKTELLVFITPHVVKSPQEARELAKKKESQSKSQQTPYRISAREHYEMGRMLYKRKKYSYSIQELQKALDTAPDAKMKMKIERLLAKAKKKFFKKSG